VQQSAALALGRLANFSEDLAEEIVDQEILPPLVSALTSDNVRESVVRECACCVGALDVRRRQALVLLCVSPTGFVGVEWVTWRCRQCEPPQKYFMKSGSFALRAVAKHSAQLASLVVEAGSLEPLVRCLEHFDATVKEAAAFALAYIAGHSEDLASAVAEAGAVPLLVLCVQEPEVGLKRVCASALSDISKHSQEVGGRSVHTGVWGVVYLGAAWCL